VSDLEVTVSCPVRPTFRVAQVAGMFDVPLAERSSHTIRAQRPPLEEPWQIGLVVGPSGSGKTTLARRLFGPSLYQPGDWPPDQAVIDAVGPLPTRQLTALLTAVGLASPPSWIKPYQVLSGGERFRCDLARALALARAAAAAAGAGGAPPLVVFDEFTSVVDRTAAQVGAAAVARAVRRAQPECRFVAVTCHYDVAPWLEPDWVLDLADGRCQRGRLRRPPVELELFRCRHQAWSLFAHHHYLSGQLSRSARCYLAAWREQPVAFCATLPVIGRRGHWRITRLVTLPDYQGLGVGLGVAEAVAQLHRDQGHRLTVTASHPALLAHCQKSACWRTHSVRRALGRRGRRPLAGYRDSAGRAVATFEYLGAAHRADHA
jgi:ABC-type hemin transport system ATPase subunit